MLALEVEFATVFLSQPIMSISIERLLGMDPPSNPEIYGVQLAAIASANASRTVPGNAHLVEALLRVGSVSDGLAAIGVDSKRALEGVRRIIAALPPRPGLGARVAKVFRELRTSSDWIRGQVDAFQDVRAKARASGLADLTGPFALAVMMGDPEQSDLLRALSDAGFSLARFRWHVAHRDAVATPCPAHGPVRVVIYDDPFTPMEFVVTTLVEVFERHEDAAKTLMMRVHEEGSVALALMEASIAMRRLGEVRSRAEKLQYPLRVCALAVSG